MPSLRVLSTVLDLPNRVKQRRSGHRESSATTWPEVPSQEPIADPVRTDQEIQPTAAQAHAHDEFKLPKTASLVIVQLASALLQVWTMLILIHGLIVSHIRRYRSLLSCPLRTSMQSTWVELPRFRVL